MDKIEALGGSLWSAGYAVRTAGEVTSTESEEYTTNVKKQWIPTA